MGTLGLSPELGLPTLQQSAVLELLVTSSPHWESMRGPEDAWRPTTSTCRSQPALNTETFSLSTMDTLGSSCHQGLL